MEKNSKEKMKSEEKMEEKKKKIAEATKNNKQCEDRDCVIHGKLKTRGRTFEGIVSKKQDRRITIMFERMIYVPKYERYKKSKTKLHARVSDCMIDDINPGDFVQIKECRPLSKIIHFIVIKKIKTGEKK